MRLLVLDDDPTFLNLIQKVGARYGIGVSCYESFSDYYMKNEGITHDAVIIDYCLEEGVSGAKTAQFFADLPTILISQKNNLENEFSSWPASVRGFVEKKHGVPAILVKALEVGFDH